MAKVTLTFEDKGVQSVSLETLIEGAEKDTDAPSSSMAISVAIVAMFNSGMLIEAAQIALEAIQNEENPTSALAERFRK